MNIYLSHKIIKEQCGTVSFKRGDAFYRGDKVRIKQCDENSCHALVRGAEDFSVMIEKGTNGALFAECTCPKLASFQKDCQHIAAVLIAIYEQGRKGGNQRNLNRLPLESTDDPNLTDQFLTLFEEQSSRNSGHQRHFEDRQVLETQFICTPVIDPIRGNRMGLSLKIGSATVQTLPLFLSDVARGEMNNIFDPNLFCFDKETNKVIQQLIRIIQNEKHISEVAEEQRKDEDLLIIPPFAWENILHLLTNMPNVKLKFAGKLVDGLPVSEGPLPLQFNFTHTKDNRFQLAIEGLERIVVLQSYRTVLADGEVVLLNQDDFHRLIELTQMLDHSKSNLLPITKTQLDFFIEKVVPGLKKLGKVKMAKSILSRFVKTPLVAKLYLDRVNNRLLAGLEFHYENIVFNPLDSREKRAASMVIREEDKEEQILQLMEVSSFAQTESGYYLQNEDLEYEFLYHMVPKLNKLVQIYATTAVRNRISKGSTFPRINVKIKKERTNWLEFKFSMDGIADNEVKELLAALEEKRKYYRLRNGSLLSLETREFAEIEQFLKTIPAQAEDLEAELNMPMVRGLQLLDSVEGTNAFHYEESFREFLDTIHHPEQLDYEVPPSFTPILRDYQVHGYKWMKTLASYGFGGILADDMGLGKTIQSIAYILSELENIRSEKLPVLVVCPSSLSYNWLGELMKFAPEIQAIVMDGNQKERTGLQNQLSDMDVVITSYPLLRKDILWYEKQHFHTVFFDEAQYFKNPLTQTARSVKMLQADHRFALTGTPIENSLEELWAIFHVVFPELFQGLKEYSKLSRSAISRRIRPFMLRRVKEDVLTELPKKVEVVETAELLPEQKKLYAAYLAKLRQDTLKHLNKETFRKNKIKILAGLTRLRQICCHPALFVDGYKGTSAKFVQLLEIIDDSRRSGRRVLIFSQFTKMLGLIGRELAIRGLPFYYLDGQTPSEERVDLCHQFNTGGRDFFLISLKAGGTGLNLTGADTVILYDLWWNPAVEEQAADRVHRMGQTNEVQVIKLVARGTIEEKMNELQDKKRDLIDEIIGTGRNASSSLSEEDIRELLNI